MRKAIVRDGLVINIIEIEEDSDWPIPEGCILVDTKTSGSPGDTWDGENFISPPPVIPTPPRSTHLATLVAIDTNSMRPARVKREYQGYDFFHDCFVTESLKDQYVEGDLQVGDYVLVHFDDSGEQVVTHKIFKSW